MIWVLWNVFEEMPHLPHNVDAALRAIGPRAQMVFIDGAYPQFDSDHRLSQDGTAGYCMDAGFYLAKPLEETAKRTAGLRFIDDNATDGDWIVVLDGDEELLDFSLPDTEVGVIEFKRDSDDTLHPRARVYRWSPGLEFRGRHYTLFDGDEMVATLRQGRDDQICGIGLHHNNSHSTRRVIAKRDYYRALVEQERRFSDAL